MCNHILILLVILFAGVISSIENENKKTCKIRNMTLDPNNIETLRNCTHFEGQIHITNDTFIDMKSDGLDALKCLETIKGQLTVTASHPLLTNLSFLENLESVASINGNSNEICIVIQRTSLKSIELPSLKMIRCNVWVQDNLGLCYDDQWLRRGLIYKRNIHRTLIGSNNLDGKQCYCHVDCKAAKCWGPGPKQCYSCNDHIVRHSNDEQVGDCNDRTDQPETKAICNASEYLGENSCKPCNHECKSGCAGPGSHQCNSCKHVKDGQDCKPVCPMSTYNLDGECKSCKDNPDPKHCALLCPVNKFESGGTCVSCHKNCIDGCTGAERRYGDGGCNFCSQVIIVNETIECMHLEDPCPGGFTDVIVTSDTERLEAFLGKKSCIQQDNVNMHASIGIGLAILMLILLCIGIWFCHGRKIRRGNGRTDVDTLNLMTDNESHVLLTELPIIKESEIRKTKKLGQGHFGTVHEAIWKPYDSNKTKSVAVKTLHQNTAKAIKEFLDEAVIMATMDHPNVLNLVAACVAAEIMLVTRLMPLGSLFNYVQNHKLNILPATLLKWSEQIAKGMAYLEEKGLVHRDLAARNVLVETVDNIKITDFGLSKLKGLNDLEKTNAKLPLKWLALECFEGKEYTHKSDVWAFGVTIWEILSFGQTPYDEIRNCDLSNELRSGKRLQQPPSCNADVYIILLRCWLEKSELRPNFCELANSFGNMSNDPNRYVARYGKGQFNKISEASEKFDSKPSVTYAVSTKCKSPSNAVMGQAGSLNLHYKNNIGLVQEIKVYDSILVKPFNTVAYQQEDYVKQNALKAKSHSGHAYNLVSNVPVDCVSLDPIIRIQKKN